MVDLSHKKVAPTICLKVHNTFSKLQAQLKTRGKKEIWECWRFKLEPKIFATNEWIKNFDIKCVAHSAAFII